MAPAAWAPSIGTATGEGRAASFVPALPDAFVAAHATLAAGDVRATYYEDKRAEDRALPERIGNGRYGWCFPAGDVDALATLPKRELLAGYAEVVKYGLIDDPGFFAWLDRKSVV